jgi:hypothetical protein
MNAKIENTDSRSTCMMCHYVDKYAWSGGIPILMF